MNPAIQQKKMKLYKKQLLEAYAPFGVVEVCHGEELAMYWEFNR